MVGKTKIRITSQIKKSCGIQPIYEWLEIIRRKRREWNEHVTRTDAERLVKISGENILAGRRSPGRS